MEDEQKFFYESELDFFGQHSPYYGGAPYESLALFNKSSSHKEDSPGQQKQPPIKAFNPTEYLKNIPENKHSEFMLYFSNHKTLNGIQHFFSFQDNQHRGEFLENIESDALGDENSNNFQLDKLFIGENKETQFQLIQNTVQGLNKRMEEINSKTISNINLSKTISHAFHEHFENFSLVLNSSNYFEEFKENFKAMAQHCKRFKGPGVDLIACLYEFWSKSFKDLINEIWRYSSKYTLNFFKKNEPQEVDSSNQHSYNSDIRSQSSNTMGSKEKRKGWSKQETECICKCIDSNIIFTQSVLKTLATQFNRSVSSVSSKIQKLIKSKKGEESQEDSLLQKAIEVLKMHEEGLTRETIIEKLNEHYEMGYGGQWEKSVGQLLSSKKQFIRIRGKHRLIHPELYRALEGDENRSKLTFKDKVMQVFLSLPNCEGELRVLVQKYIQLFGDVDWEGEAANQERRKTIESNISKTLSRYDIFDNSKAKTKYLINPLYRQAHRNEMEVENFFSL